MNIMRDMINTDRILMNRKCLLDMMLCISLNSSRKLDLRHFDIVSSLLLNLCKLHRQSYKVDKEELKLSRIIQLNMKSRKNLNWFP